MTDGVFMLRGGPCELTAARATKASPKAHYWSGVLRFRNGQECVVPLYVHCGRGKSGNEAATEVARRVGSFAARAGELNVPALIKAGTLPLDDYIRGGLTEAVRGEDFPAGLEYKVAVERKKDRLEVWLFDGTRAEAQAFFSVTVPAVGRDAELERYCKNVVAAALGAGSQRTHLKTSASRRRPAATFTITAHPLVATVRSDPLGNYNLYLQWQAGVSASASLRTKDRKAAEKRADFALGLIHEAVGTGRRVTLEAIRGKLQDIADACDASARPAQQEHAYLGPVQIRAGGRGGAGDELQLKCYIQLSGRPESGYTFNVRFAIPGGGQRNCLITRTIQVDADRDLDREQLEALRLRLREFLQAKLTAFYSAGGCFPDPDRGDSAAGGGDGAGLTEAGEKKLLAVLEGRLDSAFVHNALTAGCDNPFDLRMRAEDVSRFGKTPFVPQPAHAEVRFEGCRERALPDGSRALAFTLVWRGRDGREKFRRDVTVADRERLAELAVRIDAWTGESLRRGSPDLPVNATREFLRRQAEGLQLRQPAV